MKEYIYQPIYFKKTYENNLKYIYAVIGSPLLLCYINIEII